MRGNRYRKRGWFGEPRRHYLAAKGIKTRSYFKGQEDNLLGPDRKVGDMAEEVRRRDVSKKKEEVLKDLDEAVRDNELTGDNRELFMDRHFKKLAEEYLNEVIDKEQFEREVDIKLNDFTKKHSKKLPIFKMMEGRDI